MHKGEAGLLNMQLQPRVCMCVSTQLAEPPHSLSR